ncbi:Glycoside hydrolase family 38 protein [Mycena venus]|uniref:alpha-mannosidase n=1 Tax=Mycena venus TaxID=2733690 RepID=A0A8H6Y1X9_9AGAR|nr:Glycoside hydrolase family 38 protein [Mycena venus]
MNGHHSLSAQTQAYQRLARPSQHSVPVQKQSQAYPAQMHSHEHLHGGHGDGHGPTQAQTTTTAYPTLNPSSGAKWIKSLTQARLGQFNGGHFGDVNLGAVLYERKEDSEKYVKLEVWSAPGLTKPTFAEAMKQEFKPAKKGDSFGPSWTNHWWKVTLKVPESEFGKYERVTFEFDPGCEAMIFDVDGTPLQGITGGYGGDRRVEYIIPPAARKKGEQKLVIESSCNGMFGMGGGGIGPPDPNRYFSLHMADIVVPNQDAWRLLWDFTTLRELVDTLPGNTPLQNAALTAANAIMNTFDHRDPSSVLRARKEAEGVFVNFNPLFLFWVDFWELTRAIFKGKDWDANDGGADVYDGADDAAEKGRSLVWGIGHCHIDTAWLWPYSVTQQKTARSWATQIDLMERYEEHRFTCSQAQQWKWLEQQYPPLFKRIAAQVDAKKFHPVGGAWVEHDGNMPSGEALVRQMVYGQRYFESRFGIRCETGWLPDSFGLTGALPQLFRSAGMKYFFTQKLSWNNINNFPHTTFNWVGIDGTQVLCHMTPVDTYTAQATVGDVNRAVAGHKNLESSDTSLLVFGNGDGGGGPLPKMLENLRRIRAVTNTHRELPPCEHGTLRRRVLRLPRGEFAGREGAAELEGRIFHRGTYTSHGSIKKGNRHSEILLRDVEHIATLASLVGKRKYVYPKETINDAWEKVLLNQFHDVLPGSAIGMAYDDAEQLYAEVREAGRKILDEALDVILGGHTLHPDAASITALDQLVAYNTTFFPRREVVQVPLPAGDSALKGQVAQLAADGKTGYAVVHCASGGKPSVLAAPPVTEAWGFSPVSVYTNGADHFVLRNDSVQLTISKGRITSLLDVQLDRELIQEGATGGLVIFEDRPNYWDAWDVEIHHLEKATQLEFAKVSVVAQGPLRASVRAEVEYGQSRISVTISLDAVPASTKLDSRSMFRFDAWVDWHQRHEFLKFELPLAISSDNATYETQFGWVQRPTHKNTTWDMAKFEVCGHKVWTRCFANTASHAKGNILRISLLRAATEPDAEQDQGEHTFSWAVMPHKGHFLESDVPTAAYLFNSPLYIRALSPGSSARALNTTHSPFALSGAPNVFLETVKRGEDDSLKSSGTTTVVLRLYEAFGGHARTQLRIASGLGVEAAYETNLLEDVADGSALALRSTEAAEHELGLDLTFRGFEVKTVVLVLGRKKARTEKRESWVTVDA